MNNYIQKIQDELDRAKKKFPHYPTDYVRQVAIMAEEAGEAIKAANNMDLGVGTIEEITEEVIQTAAMCFRYLEAHGAKT